MPAVASHVEGEGAAGEDLAVDQFECFIAEGRVGYVEVEFEPGVTVDPTAVVWAYLTTYVA